MTKEEINEKICAAKDMLESGKYYLVRAILIEVLQECTLSGIK